MLLLKAEPLHSKEETMHTARAHWVPKQSRKMLFFVGLVVGIAFWPLFLVFLDEFPDLVQFFR